MSEEVKVIPKPTREQCFELTLWQPDPKNKHWQKPLRRLTFKEAAETLETLVRPYVDEYICFEDFKGFNFGADAIPEFRWVAAWVVEGANEEDYVHVEFRGLLKEKLIDDPIKFCIIKTFEGNDYAWELAKFINRVMWA